MNEIERRDVLRGGALGVGALVGAVGMAGAGEASPPGFQMAASSTASQQFWLAVKGVDGPSTTKGYEKQIPLHSFGWGVDNSAPVAGPGAGKATASPFTFTATSSKASPQLAKLACTGVHISTVVLSGVRRNAAGVMTRYLKLTLTDALVSSLHLGEANAGAPTDHVALLFGGVTFVIDSVSMTFDFASSTG